MVFHHNMLNQRQCRLLADMLASGYQTIADHMRKNLEFKERNTKWKVVEHPLRELVRTFRESESYIRQCLETKSFWAKAISLYQSTDCIEFYVHNLLTAIPTAIEAIEMAGQISGTDQDDIMRRKLVYSAKYNKDVRDPRVFQMMFGDHYLVSQDFCTRIGSVWDEDRWLLLNKIKEKKRSSSKRDHRLADMLMRYLMCNNNFSEMMGDEILVPSSTLVGSKDYQVRRRLGNGSHYKEIQWLGESFALRHFHGEVEALVPRSRPSSPSPTPMYSTFYVPLLMRSERNASW
ncbi:Protein kinase family protein [Striga hermonthica]|uniref:Protein kinase family protein n=1 Tax=Striga hermonthica TaxID=68872 RepID=A0A9N7MWP7_STRHE|nr:Protein kinase family protein [Striga hermonthica]